MENRAPLRLIGVSLTQLDHGSETQLSLFHDSKKEKNRKLDLTLDNIRKRYGMDKLQRGSTMQSSLEVGKKYKAQMENKRSDVK